MNDLNVIDVSALVYTGALSKYFCDRRYYNLPVGGIHYLMRQVSNAFRLRDCVVLCFDSPSFRAKLDPNYKSGRMRNPEVFNQIERIYDGLMSAGIPCYKFDGYEADDIVHWAVQQAIPDFSQIVVVGNDIDLCHEVQPKVRFKSIVEGVGSIHSGNFSSSVDDTFTMLNTISAKKALCGCNSDKIPTMKFSGGFTCHDVYTAFCDWLRDNGGSAYRITTNPVVLEKFVGSSSSVTEDEMCELRRRIKLVYPADCPEGTVIKPVGWSNVNKDALFKFLTMCGDKDSLLNLGGSFIELSETDKQNLRDAAHRLNSGEFAADRNLQQESRITVKTLDLDSFERDF